MSDKLDNVINTFVKMVRKVAPEQAVFLRVDIMGDSHNYSVDERTPKELEMDGISMRNLSGEFIKERVIVKSPAE